MKKDESRQPSGQNQSEVQPTARTEKGKDAAADAAAVLEHKMICLCMGVSEADIKHAVEAGAKDFLDVQATTNAGLGCGTCPPQVKTLIKKYQAAKKTAKPTEQ